MAEDLPAHIYRELVTRWSEPHRIYHGLGHLRQGLSALAELGGGRLERIAFWFHDAVHTNTSPSDERASAELARNLLTDQLPTGELAEVCRLIMITAEHHPAVDDLPGARISDADLSALAGSWPDYRHNALAIRAELPQYSDADFRLGRSRFLAKMLQRPRLFFTPHAQRYWEIPARKNLARELAEVRMAS